MQPMSRSLKNNYNSDYVAMSNRLTNHKDTIEVWVEDEYDIPFWNNVLSEECGNLKFKITPYRNSELNTGKGNILKYSGQLGPHLIACVDSDYDYLLGEHSEYGRKLASNPYIVQTYTYAIENHNCAPYTLKALCVNATLEMTDFDFEKFFKDYSLTVYPLLLWSLILRRNRRENVLPFNYFKEIVSPCMPISAKSAGKVLNSISDNVKQAVRKLEKTFPEDTAQMPYFKQEMSRKLLRPDNTYLFLNGHILEDMVEKDLLIPICRNLVRNHIRTIYQSRATLDEKKRKKLHYDNITRRSISVLLASNFDYKDNSEIYNRLLKPRLAKLKSHLSSRK